MAGARSSFVRMSWCAIPVLESSWSMSRSVSLGPWRESSNKYAFLSLEISTRQGTGTNSLRDRKNSSVSSAHSTLPLYPYPGKSMIVNFLAGVVYPFSVLV